MSRIVLTHYFYFFLLLFSIFGLLILDYRYKLAFWRSLKPSIYTISCSLALFLLFDVLGIVNKIFATNQKYVIGIYAVSKNLPLEEFLFLFLLSYLTLLLYIILAKKIGDKNA